MKICVILPPDLHGFKFERSTSFGRTGVDSFGQENKLVRCKQGTESSLSLSLNLGDLPWSDSGKKDGAMWQGLRI